MVNGQFDWPKPGRKPNAIIVNEQTRGRLMPNGCYVVLRRFTSKEEKRRVVAYLLDADALPGALVGFEYHLNVIHEDRHGLDPTVARGIAAYLSSQAVDDYFRTFSGHTQVNATDLRRLRYPDIKELGKLGERVEEVRYARPYKSWSKSGCRGRSSKRHEELKRLFAGCKAGIVYVTAFPTRTVMAKYLPAIAWETEVWCAESPTHIIHFNGERFLGPY